jgi:hypothetical protein
MLEVAVAVAHGDGVLGMPALAPRRVLYVDFENDPRGDIRERLKAMGRAPDDLDNLVYLSFPVLAALDSPQGGVELMAAVRTYGCEVVIIDTVSRAVKGEENDNDTWLNFYRHTGKLLKRAGVALMRLDHTGKDETRGQRGGSAKSGDVDAVWRMSVITKDRTYRLDCEANRMPVLPEMQVLVLHRETAPVLRHRVDAAGRAAAYTLKRAALMAALEAAEIPADAGRGVVRKALKTVGLSVGNDTLTEIIRERKLYGDIDDD